MSIFSYTHQGQSNEAQAASSSSGAEPGPSETSPPQKKSAMAMVFADFKKTEERRTKPLSDLIHENLIQGHISVDEDPLAWWKSNEHKYPHIAKLAQRNLAVQGTSVPSERVFSTAGDIVTSSRSRLLAENVDKLIFLQKNMKIK